MSQLKLALLLLAAVLLPAGTVMAQASTTATPKAKTADAPTAQAILAKSLEAIGGKEALASVKKNRVSEGTLKIPVASIQGKFVEYHQRPDITSVHVEIDGLGKQNTGSRNGYAWDSSDMAGSRLLEGAELATQLRQARFDKELEYEKLYEKIEVTGEKAIDGKDCWELTFTPRKDEGEPEITYYDKESYLPVRSVTSVDSPQMGQLRVQMDLKEYKKFGKLLMPTLLVQSAAGMQVELKTEKIEFDVEIPEDALQPPAEIAKMLELKKSGDGK